MEQFREINSSDRELNELQLRLRRVLAPVTGATVLDGVLIESVALSATVNNVAHGLGRAYRGWIVTDRDANQTVYRDGTSTADPVLFLPLLAGGAVTVDLWVF